MVKIDSFKKAKEYLLDMRIKFDKTMAAEMKDAMEYAFKALDAQIAKGSEDSHADKTLQ